MLTVIGKALTYWLNFTVIGLVLLLGITSVGYGIQQISGNIMTLFTKVQWYLIFTIIGIIIPIGIGYQRNKPQWLKLLLAIVEITMLIALMIELAYMYL